MGTKLHTSTSTTRTFYRAFLPLLVALSLLASQLTPFALVGAADASSTLGGFEHADGNVASDGAEDWLTVTEEETYSSTIDPVPGNPVKDDDVFKGGMKDDDRTTSGQSTYLKGWELVDKDLNDGKFDIDRAAVYSRYVNPREAYLYLAAGRFASSPNVNVTFELNQQGWTYADTSNPAWPPRKRGDLRIMFDMEGNTQGQVNVFVDEWDADGVTGKWVARNTNGYGAVNLQNIDWYGRTYTPRTFAEVGIDIAALYAAVNPDNPNIPCVGFGTASVRSRSSGSGGTDASLKDFVGPFDVSVDFCSEIRIRKVDDTGDPTSEDPDVQGNGLAGAQFEVKNPSGTTILTCTTDADGYCADPNGVLSVLDPGTYTITETVPPPGYRFSDPRSRQVPLGTSANEDIVFDNPPINYRISVEEDGDNAVGNPHDFEVTLFTDFIFDYDTGQVVVDEDEPTEPLSGATVDLNWSGPGDVKVGTSETDEDGWAAITPVADPSDFTCTTGDDGTRSTGPTSSTPPCVVRVLSGSPDDGTLTGTYDLTTVYQHTTGSAATDPANETSGVAVDSISDSAYKAWYGFQVELDPPAADNPLGIDHPFTATVYRVSPSEDGLVRELAGDVEVSLTWTAPDGTAGSGILAGDPATASPTGSCTTASDGEDEGTCTVTVRSPDGPGTGTLSVSRLDGFVVPGERLIVDHYTQEEVDADETLDGPVVEATKTWWDYLVTVEATATNPLGEDHPFTVTVKRTDGSLTGPEGEQVLVYEPVQGARLALDWDGVGQIKDGTNTCASTSGTDAAGQCTVIVESDEIGTGTLSVEHIVATTLYDYLEGGPFPFPFDPSDPAAPADFDPMPSASKTWVDWEFSISAPALNPAGVHDEDGATHTFTVFAQVSSGDGYVNVPDGTRLTLDYGTDNADPSLVIDDSSCTVDGTTLIEVDDETSVSGCTIEVSSEFAGQLTVTVTGIGATELDGYDQNDGIASFDLTDFLEEDELPTSSKTWLEYRVLADDNATNLVGDPHTFELTVQQTAVPPADRDDADGSADWEAVPDETILDVSTTGLAGTVDEAASTCLTGGTEDGTCTIVVDSSSPGTVTVTVDGFSVDLFDGETDVTYALDIDEAVQSKTWIRYRALTGPDAVNLVGDPHTFRVFVEQDLGDGWKPVPNGTTLVWDFPGENGARVGSNVAAGTTCDGPGTELTLIGEGDDAAERALCEIVVNSFETGKGVLTITGIGSVTAPDGTTFVTADFDGLDDAFSGDSASKTWVDLDVTISGDAINPLGAPHTFLVGATIDSGSGHLPAIGATITGTWDGEEVSCVTRGPNGIDPELVGTCEIPVNSPTEAGSLTLTLTQLSYTYWIDNTHSDTFTIDLSTEDAAEAIAATKTWRDYAATVDEDDVNLTGDPHTFTVTIDQTDDGKTWTAVPDGTTVTEDGVTWTGVGDVVKDPDRSTCFGVGTAGGNCTVAVESDDAGEGTLTITEIHTKIDDEGIEAHLDRASFDFTIDGENRIPASKTWIEFDVTVSPNAVNNLGDPHPFLVTVTVDDGSGEAPAPADGAKVTASFEWDEPTQPELTGLTCTTDGTGTCTITVDAPTDDGSPVAGKGTLTLEQLEYTYDGYDSDWPFVVDLTNVDADGLVAGFEVQTSTKVWAAYQLTVTPPRDINLLHDDEEGGLANAAHPFTVQLTSDDNDELPIAGQELVLELDSTVVTEVSVTDALGGDRAPTYDDDGRFTCTTRSDGTCLVTATTDSPGTATLIANFSTEIQGETFEADEAEGHKTWTTYRIRIENSPAVNLLGTPHVFDVYVEKTDGDTDQDGLIWYPVDVAASDLELALTPTGDGASIVETERADDCANGASGGFCTVTVDSTVTGPFVLTVTYTAENITWAEEEQVGAFSENGEKRWIDFRVMLSEDAENLIDTNHVFEVLVEADFGDGFGPVEGAQPEIDVDGVGQRVGSVEPHLPDCADGTDADGMCFVTITSAVPGTTTVTATYEGSTSLFDPQIAADDVESDDYFDDGTKTWVDYLLEVSPDAINAVGDPHDFVYTLQRSVEAGVWTPEIGEELEVVLSGPGTITAVSAGTIAEDARSATCTTGADGQCAVTIVSSEPGTSTLTASYEAVVEDTSRTDTATGTKHWAAIDLVKTALIDEDEDGFKTVTFSTDPDVDNPVVTYEYTITNIGPVALTVTSLEDDVLGTITLPETLVLEPGESHTATAEHPVTRDDADAGEIYNVAIVDAEAEDGTEVSAWDDEEVFVITVLASGSIDLIKTALVDRDEEGNRTFTVAEGETAVVTYRYLITNNGNVAISDLSLFDDKIGDIDVPDVTLEPGESITVEADYTVTAADLAAGEVENIAIVTGLTPDGVEVSDQDDEIVFPVEVLDVTITKPLPRTGADAGLLLTLGLLLAALGAAALLMTPRRRRQQ
jgi:hypothetical protein